METPAEEDAQRSAEQPINPEVSQSPPPRYQVAPDFIQAYPGAPPVPSTLQTAHRTTDSRPNNGATDDRPRTLSFVSLGIAIVGVALLLSSLGGYVGIVMIYMPGSEYAAGILLLAAIVLSIIALGSRGQGGKRIGLAALIIAVAGGVVAVLTPAILFILIVTADMRAFN